MSDNCTACCKACIQNIESERAGRLDLERRFEQTMREQFIRRESITRLELALQDKTTALLCAEGVIEGLNGVLAKWQELVELKPNLPLHLARAELCNLPDPFDVKRVEDLPEVQHGD